MHRLGTTLNHRRERLCLEQGKVTKACFLNRQRSHRGNRSVTSSDGILVPKEALTSFPDETTFQSSLSVYSRKLISNDMWKSARTLLCVHTWFDIVFWFFPWFICNSPFLIQLRPELVSSCNYLLVCRELISLLSENKMHRATRHQGQDQFRSN